VAKGFTQEKLAFEADVVRIYIRRLVDEHKSPTVEVMFRICRALVIPVSVLIARVEQYNDG